MGITRQWFRRQEARPWHPFNLILFSLFTGVLRGLLEALLFQGPLDTFTILNYFPFYLNLGLCSIFLLNRLGGLRPARAGNIVLIGIFIGIFPPLIDLVALGFQADHRYLYVRDDWRNAPWFFYAPDKGYSWGEAFALWFAVVMSGLYTASRKNLARGLLVGAGVYLLLIFSLAVLPVWVFQNTGAELTGARQLLARKSSVYYLSWWLIFSGQLAIWLVNTPLMLRLFRRTLHTIPFVLAALLGGKLTGGLDREAALAGLVVWYWFQIVLLQNDFTDRNSDASRRPIGIGQKDVLLANALFLTGLGFLGLAGESLVLPVVMAWAAAVLYHYDFYRAKRYFPAIQKIEGIWGLAAFLAGMLAHPQNRYEGRVIIWAFLMFGGFSLFSLAKDLKDIRADRRAGIRTLWVHLLRRGSGKVRLVLKIYFLSLFVGLISIAVWFFSDHNPLPGVTLAAFTLGLAWHSRRNIFRAGWFQGFLIGMSACLLTLLWGLRSW